MTNKLWTAWSKISQDVHFVDLTHSFHAGQPKFSALPDEQRTRLFTVKEHGFEIDQYSFVGQWGTHVDPPVHFVDGGRTLDELDVAEMILPGVVFDFSAQAAQNPDFSPTVEDILAWEESHGRIPEGAFAILRTDWSKRWPDAEAMNNADADGVNHYPAWNVEVVKFLLDERGVLAIGHETTDTDLGTLVQQGQLPTELYLLQQDRWQVELLTNVDQLPATGSLIVATWPKPLAGTGFPARVFAIVEN